jgi:hypothetical protein
MRSSLMIVCFALVLAAAADGAHVSRGKPSRPARGFKKSSNIADAPEPAPKAADPVEVDPTVAMQGLGQLLQGLGDVGGLAGLGDAIRAAQGANAAPRAMQGDAAQGGPAQERRERRRKQAAKADVSGDVFFFFFRFFLLCILF